jgi:hypothetical protein
MTSEVTRADRRREHRVPSRNAKTPPSDDYKPQTEIGRPCRPKMTNWHRQGIVQAGAALLQSYEIMGFDNEILHEISSLNHKPPCISGLGGLRPVPTRWHIAHSPSLGRNDIQFHGRGGHPGSEIRTIYSRIGILAAIAIGLLAARLIWHFGTNPCISHCFDHCFD